MGRGLHDSAPFQRKFPERALRTGRLCIGPAAHSPIANDRMYGSSLAPFTGPEPPEAEPLIGLAPDGLLEIGGEAGQRLPEVALPVLALRDADGRPQQAAVAQPPLAQHEDGDDRHVGGAGEGGGADRQGERAAEEAPPPPPAARARAGAPRGPPPPRAAAR